MGILSWKCQLCMRAAQCGLKEEEGEFPAVL